MRQVTVAGGNLFAVAAGQYGDPLQWHRIATANGLTDPFLSGVVTLAVPARNANYSGDGIRDQ